MATERPPRRSIGVDPSQRGQHDRLPGVLRALVLFHEAEVLGAGRAVLQVVDALGACGWSISGWIPGEGPLIGAAAQQLATVQGHPRPIAFSRRGWREESGLLNRLGRAPGYLRAVRTSLLRVRPQLVHANT